MKRTKKMITLLLVFACMAGFVVQLWAGEQKGDRTTKNMPVNLNEASIEILSDLKGVGPKYADRIIQYRKEYGPFKRIDDLVNVPGIGTKILEANRDRLTVE